MLLDYIIVIKPSIVKILKEKKTMEKISEKIRRGRLLMGLGQDENHVI